MSWIILKQRGSAILNTDKNFASDEDTMRFISGFIVKMDSSTISWHFQKL